MEDAYPICNKQSISINIITPAADGYAEQYLSNVCSWVLKAKKLITDEEIKHHLTKESRRYSNSTLIVLKSLNIDLLRYGITFKIFYIYIQTNTTVLGEIVETFEILFSVRGKNTDKLT